MMTYDWKVLHSSTWLALAGVGFVAIGCVTAANAQSPATMGTNVKGVGIVAPPPAGFNPLTATASERKTYAVPPEPDKTLAPLAHAMWERAMADFTKRETGVEVKQTNRYHGPNQPVGRATQLPNNITSVTSNNWSGTAVASNTDPFAVEVVYGIFHVPAAHVPIGTCDGTTYYSSLWPGIDGYGSSDVL
jgi:hypothetical protein